MIPKVIEAKYVRDFVLHLRFADGTEGDVDLGDKLGGGVFAPLCDPAYFRQATVHPELHTVVWPNGADFAPEFLHERVQVKA
ncbi:MAG: DUF2442 domain-containing protein [Candidatus Nealsonbacteria bacterium]|nr:DUF2442 domain-containing protein [Candidatus Nealsonbacteria bacterium]